MHTGKKVARGILRFMQYAALVGSLVSLSQGNIAAATGLFLLALSIEKMLVKLFLKFCENNPELYKFAEDTEKKGYSYPSQAFGLFANAVQSGIKTIKG